MREVISVVTGIHYRLHPKNPVRGKWVVQEEVKVGAVHRWKTHSRWANEDVASGMLASLGRLIPPADLPDWAREDGDDVAD